MSESIRCEVDEPLVDRRAPSFIKRFFAILLKRRSNRRPKRIAPGDLSPALMRDIGLSDTKFEAASLHEKWRLEMDLQSK
ncbi:hypothetical protein [uncultured Roseibium sp.]|uniref:hypothetical protein n=1 Tax=uncultured Roseibium sp. TaxID=1936171 RepID=UPI00260FCDA3|nr:hypothetical protein [uncultured Roseibium sp.]